MRGGLRLIIRDGQKAVHCFDIKDRHRLVDPAGSDCKNDADAIEKVKVIAIGVSLDKPEVDPTRHIAVINSDGHEVSRMPVYSKPSGISAFPSLCS